MLIFIIFVHFYFSAKDISLNIQVKIMKFETDVENIHNEGTLSQIFYLGPSFYFIRKNGKLLVYFSNIFFLIS